MTERRNPCTTTWHAIFYKSLKIDEAVGTFSADIAFSGYLFPRENILLVPKRRITNVITKFVFIYENFLFAEFSTVIVRFHQVKFINFPRPTILFLETFPCGTIRESSRVLNFLYPSFSFFFFFRAMLRDEQSVEIPKRKPFAFSVMRIRFAVRTFRKVSERTRAFGERIIREEKRYFPFPCLRSKPDEKLRFKILFTGKVKREGKTRGIPRASSH